MDTSLPDLGYFRFTETELLGHTCYLSRTGYTGEFGYELYIPSEHAGLFWDRILLSGDGAVRVLGAPPIARAGG